MFPCEREDKQVAASIPGDIATAVVRSLLGTAIDAAVAYLDDPRASAFDVVLPVESIEDITSGNSKNCLYLSSGRLDVLANPNGRISVWSDIETIEAPFFAKIRFVKPANPGGDSASPLRPVVLAWKYASFLEPSCPLLRNCSKRDVAVSLSFMPPVATVAGRTVGSEPIGFVVTSATPSEVEAAIRASNAGAALPWFLPVNLKGPMNVRFSLIETSQPNAFTKALAAALAANKTVMQDSVENKLKGVSDQIAAEAAQKNVAAAAQAFDDYKKAFDVAIATKLAFEASSDQAQRIVLRAQYTVQRESARLGALLAEAAFKTATLTWSAGGLGPLPDL